MTKAVFRQWKFLILPLSHARVRTAFGESSPFIVSAHILWESKLIDFSWGLGKEKGVYFQLIF